MYTINELRQRIFPHIYNVYEIFKNFFGEEFTDLQRIPDDVEMADILRTEQCKFDENNGCWEASDEKIIGMQQAYLFWRADIIVHWPEVKVTNEHDKFIVIQDLFAKIEVKTDGTIPWENRGFQLVRSTFDKHQYNSGYLHSHIIRFSGFPSFSNPCLGSGPINQTILSLKNHYEELTWMLFCQELALYVTVESLTGGPYMKLEQVIENIGPCLDSKYDNSITIPLQNAQEKYNFLQRLKEFTVFYLNHGHLSLNYKDNSFKPGLPYFQYMVDVSNAFIEWFNQNGSKEELNYLYEKNLLREVMVKEEHFYSLRNRRPSGAVGERLILKFKGEDIKLKIIDRSEFTPKTSVILNHNVAMLIIHNILKIINYRYKNEHNRTTNSSRQGEETDNISTATYKKVLYI